MVELACRKDPVMPAVYGKRGCRRADAVMRQYEILVR